ncbi:MAG: hypothetical protein NTV74_06560 [Euryarchaeota archaeon]|nr:hypothetical protein [Euryarchaeota archaeon]
MYNRVHYAVSDVIAIILVFMIVSTTVGFILLWGTPYIDEKKAQSRKESALTQFSMITDIIKDDVISQGFRSRKNVEFRTDSGYLNLDSQGERFILYYSLDKSFDFNVSGLGFDGKDKEFNFKIENGLANNLTIKYLYDGISEFIDPIPGEVITAKGLLSDAVQIDVINNIGKIVVGRIWLFDTGSIQYETSSSYTTYSVIIENGAVLSNQQNYGFLYCDPTIYNNDDVLGIRIIQLKPSSIVGAGGSSGLQCRFTIKLNNSYLREDSARVPVCLKMQVFGNDASVKAWKNYFTSLATHGFSQFPDGTLYLKPDGGMNFTLTHSVCDVSMRVVG